MIDPVTLEKFKTDLAKLVGETFDEVHYIKTKRFTRHVIFFAVANRGTNNTCYDLEIAECAWQVLHDDNITFSYLQNTEHLEEAHLQLWHFKGDTVKHVHFDTADLSLSIHFDSGYTLKLIQDKAQDWYYEFRVNIDTGYLVGFGWFYEVRKDDVGQGVWNS
jgi:hypothetical protein